MPKMVQVRNVPEPIHRELVRRARRHGRTLTDYLQEILQREVSHPDPQEIFERISRRPRIRLPRAAADLIREDRSARMRS